MTLAEALARNPTNYVELSGTIESILEHTEWPQESNEAVQDLLRVIRQVPRWTLNELETLNETLTANRAMQNVWEKVKGASLTYNMRKRGLFRQMKALLGGGVKSCTSILSACRNELILAFPETPFHSRDRPRYPPTVTSYESARSRDSVSEENNSPVWQNSVWSQLRSRLRGGRSAVSPSPHHPRADIVEDHPDIEYAVGPSSPSSSSSSLPRMRFVARDGLPLAGLGEEGLAPPVPVNIPSSGSVADVGTQITWISPTPIKVNGHFCDVFAGTHSRVGKVALKRPRIAATGNSEDVMRRFQREAETWARLQHPHILEYLGTFQRDGHYYFVSPFIENGTLVEYIELHPSVNRIKLMCETADAIAYLHRQDVVHGDIKANNLLIGDNGQVLLCDFGLTRATDFRTSTAMRGAGTLRWQSPELWNGGSKSFKSDVYAFGMTIVEVLTEAVPFPDLETDGAVICAVLIEGRRPPKIPTESSAGLSYEKVWAVAEACWSAEPEERISMSEALQRI